MRILLVEDEIKLGKATKKALETQKYAVDLAVNGKNGLDMAIGEKYNLIILDIMLPEIDGLEILKKIREANIHTPVLMLTARGQINDKVIGLDVGADDYVVKPFSFEELFARIRALIRRPAETTNSHLKVKDLTLDPSTFKVEREGKRLRLSSKEFSLLEFLMRHKNTVVTKEQIVNYVWNYDADVLPSTVEVHIKHLRDKVDSPFQIKLIHTARGFGYEIRED